ncbi:MAG: DUF349 domain-containing protein [Firmicutes bacterium]|nr:DUF349 domain-containing protein [Bacillota bacterium]MCM1401361.1 DUF349 domain-containing protein [Bacteroides sp.]MCM1477386.1 DUF349 domain-containing protein [Bacteroides sp.]
MESHENVNLSDEQVVDQSLTPSATSETAPAAEGEVAAVVETETEVPATEVPLDATGEHESREEAPTMETVMARLEALAGGSGADVTADEVGRLKQQFYGLVNDAMVVQRDEFVAAGNDPETFMPHSVPEEPRFKELMAQLKELRNAYRAKLEAEQLQNLERKQAIVAELTEMASDTDNVNRHYPRAKELQTEFKAIGDVPQQNTTQIWKSFQDAVEHFYDQWKVNKELRDYDFKKNLSEKQLLIDEANELTSEEDVVTAFRRLQELHDKWRAIGPVAKDLREEIWAKFKDASAEINKRYQAFFEERKQREQLNEDAKTALCERIESIDTTALATFAAWNEATRQIMDAQKEWKTLGYASRKANNLLFNRFRACCDKFFAEKAEFFRNMKNSLADNLAAKTRLCEQAEALVESTDWRKTTDAIVALQKEWKTIGSVPKKHSDAIWQRFMAACNGFFDRKKKASSNTRRTEQANLKAKLDILAELGKLNTPECELERTDAIARLNELRAAWQATGHVPFREKDKLHNEYRETVKVLADKFDIHDRRARMDNFKTNIEAGSSDRTRLLRERDRLMRAFEGRKAELATYENNLSFLSARSRSGASMLGEMERNIQRLKNSIEELEAKVNIIDANLAE